MLLCKRSVVSSSDSTGKNGLFSKENVILGDQLKSYSMLNAVANNVFLHVKSYIWKCKLLNLVPPYNKLVEYKVSRTMLEWNLENLF